MCVNSLVERDGDLVRIKQAEMEASALVQLSFNKGRPRSMPKGHLCLHGCSVPGFHPSHKTLTGDTRCGQ